MKITLTLEPQYSVYVPVSPRLQGIVFLEAYHEMGAGVVVSETQFANGYSSFVPFGCDSALGHARFSVPEKEVAAV